MSDDPRRVNLNLRVDEDVKRSFDAEIETKFGKCGPYAGIELERESRYFLDEGEFAELKHVVEDLADTLDGSASKEKIRETSRDTSVVVGYQIAEDVRTELLSAADDDYRSPGELVEAIMHTYVTEGSVIERLTQKLQMISEQAGPDEKTTSGAKERRTKTIAQELAESGGDGFTLDEFDEAVKPATGISASDYVRETYLPRVLDKLDFTWHPQKPELFVDPESYELPDTRDPTHKPVILMDEDDMRLAIKTAAYREAGDGLYEKGVFSTRDGVHLLEGNVRKSTVRELMKRIADNSPGYRFDEDEDILKVDRQRIKRDGDLPRDVMIVESRDSTGVEGDD